MMDTFNGALTLNQRLLQGMREAPDVVRRGLLIVLLVGVLVGSVNGARVFLAVLDPARATGAQRAELARQIEQSVALATPAEGQAAMRAVLELPLTILDAGTRLGELPTGAPRPVGAVISTLSLIVTTPVGYLGSLLLAVIFAHIGARQMGGKGTIQQMLGLGALSVAPHALDALSFVPVLGPTLGLIAWGWGLVILVAATGVAHRLDSGRATLAVLLYPGLLLVLGALAYCGLVAVSLALLSSL